jgi:hypothetical protein
MEHCPTAPFKRLILEERVSRPSLCREEVRAIQIGGAPYGWFEATIEIVGLIQCLFDVTCAPA